MKEKTSAHYQREYRRRLRELGLVKKEAWIRPENAKWLAKFEKLLRVEFDETLLENGVLEMTEMKKWTTQSLFDALATDPLFDGDRATIELIDGVAPALHLVMHDQGDLPLFLTASGEQILVEAVLWSEDDVSDTQGFNDAVLRTHKFFPLSTISLDVLGDGKAYYQMFGALSATSILSNVIFEIEVLASNVIQAAEAYSEYLVLQKQATK